MKKLLAMLLLLCLTASCALAEAPAAAEPSTATTLVVYFSATGNTRPLAEYAAAYLSADLYEIVAAQPYTDADLDYGDNKSRTTLEQGDDTVRPEIDGLMESIDGYDTIYLGYPIWWGEAPRIISTFLESFDFSGKTIIPFCTSASSGVGSSAKLLHDLCSEDTIWMDGTRFAIGTDESKVTAWIDGMNASK
ncbi:MAG: flavodoxin [Eubacteriales bacterium]|nr:flavodoxin [Eubacteriales bacterium]